MPSKYKQARTGLVRLRAAMAEKPREVKNELFSYKPSKKTTR